MTVVLVPANSLLMAAWTVVPAVVLVPGWLPSPCQPSVQPPHCLARESAPLPRNDRILFEVLLLGEHALRGFTKRDLRHKLARTSFPLASACVRCPRFGPTFRLPCVLRNGASSELMVLYRLCDLRTPLSSLEKKYSRPLLSFLLTPFPFMCRMHSSSLACPSCFPWPESESRF